MSIKKLLGLSFLIYFGWSCQSNAPQKRNLTAPADRYFEGDSLRRNAIYYGGTIITMEGDAADTTAEAVVVHDGVIIFIGKRTVAFEQFPESKYLRVDLKGSALLPGFIDGHGHFSQVAYQIGSADLLPPDQPGDVGGVTSKFELNEKMRAFMKDYGGRDQYLGMNYDHTQFTNGAKEHPTKIDLDSLSSVIPIVVIHQSGHVGSVNSAVLNHEKMQNIVANGIPGGTVEMGADGKPTGYLEENALMAVMQVLKAFKKDDMFNLFDQTANKYAENGFTTVQDGRTMPSNWTYLKQYDFEKKLKLDIVAYPDMFQTWTADSVAFSAMISKQYLPGSHFRTGGVKFSLDGSPQGRTGWFVDKYLWNKENGNVENYNGVPIFPAGNQADTLKLFLERSLKNNWQILAHCNGDSAVQQLQDIFASIQAKQPKLLQQDHRTTLIHAQFITEQQVKASKRLGMSVSTYPLHTFYWGDVHELNLGPERSNRMSPTRWLVNEKVNFSIHTDAPVIFPRSIPLFMTAVRRVSRAGVLYGENHCLTPYETLRAMTLWPAYHHFEENTKGSIKVGKIADFVILDKNPLNYPFNKTEPIKAASKNTKPLYKGYDFNEIKIWETIKNGIPVYQNKNSTVKEFKLPRQANQEPHKLTLGCG